MGFQPCINIHADDYGMTAKCNARIQTCWEQGRVNAVSVMVNGNEPLLPEDSRVPVALHLNLVEGKALTPAEQVPLLVREDGYLKHSFFWLMILSLSPKRRQLEQQLYLEIQAQLVQFQRLFPNERELLLDSHQHTHMIPLVFSTLLRAIRDLGLEVSYMRIPAEPIGPFLREPSLYLTYRPTNLVKNAVLNFLWYFNRKQFRESGISTAIFCGILFSGEMDQRRLAKVFPHFLRLAQNRGMDLEFLFHPGAILPGEPFLDPKKTGFCDFYRSSGRLTDGETVRSDSWRALIQTGQAQQL